MDGFGTPAAFWDVSSVCAFGAFGEDESGLAAVITLAFRICLGLIRADVLEPRVVGLTPTRSPKSKRVMGNIARLIR